jgi:hypothetical protein
MKTKVLVSNGNMKIGKDTLILNMGPAVNCPSRQLGLCQIGDKCYAMKAERCYKQVLPYRLKQEQIWDQMHPNDIAVELIEIARRKRNRIRYLRFSEAGDFYDQSDVNKMSTRIYSQAGSRFHQCF